MDMHELAQLGRDMRSLQRRCRLIFSDPGLARALQAAELRFDTACAELLDEEKEPDHETPT